MSRAFVSESDGLDSEQLPEFHVLLPPGSRNYMTAEGAGRLKSELDALVSIERAAVLTTIKKLGAEGNESGAQKQAQFDLLVLDRKIEYLSRLASTMEIVETRALNTDTAGFGAWVTVQDTTGGQKTYRIVGAYESDPDEGTISRLSPLAKALIGKRAGDRIDVKLPEGNIELVVTSVSYATARDEAGT
jgi:transcription elongation factor GreB